MASNRDSAIYIPPSKIGQKIDFSQPLETVVDPSVLKGKTAIVQDGGTGLGLGIASALAEHGAKVAICGGDAKAGDTAQNDLVSRGFTASYFKTDTSDWNSSLSAFKQVIAWSEGQLDIVVTSVSLSLSEYSHHRN